MHAHPSYIAPPHFCVRMRINRALKLQGSGNEVASVPGLPRSFTYTYAQFISACGAHINGEGLGLIKYHVRIVGGAIAKALLLFPEARSPSHLVEEPVLYVPRTDFYRSGC